MDFADAYIMCKLGHPELAGWWGKLLGGGVKTLYTITPKQQGAGEPSPDNIRPILPGLTLTRDDDTVLEVYGGTLDVTSGTLTVDMVALTVATAPRKDYGISAAGAPYLDMIIPTDKRSVPNGACVCSMYSQILQSQAGTSGKFRCYSNSISVYDSRFTSKSSAESTLAMDGFHVVYPLATPITYQLTQAEVKRAVAVLRH